MKESFRLIDRAINSFGKAFTSWATGIPRNIVDERTDEIDRYWEQKRKQSIEDSSDTDPSPPTDNAADQ